MSDAPAPVTVQLGPTRRARPAPPGRPAPIHDFRAKLAQPSVVEHLTDYVAWQIARRSGEAGAPLPEPRDHGPISINLDLTTACNYRCDHCVDLEILNGKDRFRSEDVLSSLDELVRRGLRSVILIGGGEPTLSPHLGDVVRRIVRHGLSLGIVSNGSRMGRIVDIAGQLGARDWVRLSLDAGTDATFQAMHRPRTQVTLEEICAGARDLRDANSDVQIGFSYIVVPPGAQGHVGQDLVPNVDEMARAAALARDHGFDYISFKPFLTRSEDGNAEVVHLAEGGEADALREALTGQLRAARAVEGDRFRVVASVNLERVIAGGIDPPPPQPRNCHMTYFRQVVSPLGTFNCPVYRDEEPGRVGPATAYATADAAQESEAATLRNILEFDASVACREVTCLYNAANWAIEDLIEDGSPIPTSEECHDWFL